MCSSDLENLQDGSGNGGGNALCFPFFYDVFGAGKNQRGNMDRAKLCFFDVRLFEYKKPRFLAAYKVAKMFQRSAVTQGFILCMSMRSKRMEPK